MPSKTKINKQKNIFTFKNQTRQRGVTKKYLTEKDKRELGQLAGDAAVLLFDHYLSKTGLDNYLPTDEKAANCLGWKTSKAKNVRLKLARAHWFHQTKNTLNDGTKLTMTFLGPDAVNEAKGEPLSIWENMAICDRVLDELNIKTMDKLKSNPDAKALYKQYAKEERQ